MTKILFQRVDAKPHASPVDLPRARRRLSALVRRHADHSRPYIVSVHRRQGLKRAEPLAVTDLSVRLRKTWAATTIGPHDAVIITYLPRGGGGSASSGNSSRGKGAAIGLLVATVALAAIGQFWAIGALAPFVGGTAVASTIWAAGSALALAGGAYLLSRATQAKANKTDDRPVYGVAGGGNLPRSGDRIPVIYGRCWTTPDLSQPDYTTYSEDGDSQILWKRLTVGCGKYAIKTIRAGQIALWPCTDHSHDEGNADDGDQRILAPGRGIPVHGRRDLPRDRTGARHRSESPYSASDSLRLIVSRQHRRRGRSCA